MPLWPRSSTLPSRARTRTRWQSSTRKASTSSKVARNARQVQLSDGDINLTILKWKTDEDADVGPNGENYSGIHHIGFQVDSLEDTGTRLRIFTEKRLSDVK